MLREAWNESIGSFQGFEFHLAPSPCFRYLVLSSTQAWNVPKVQEHHPIRILASDQRLGSHLRRLVQAYTDPEIIRSIFNVERVRAKPDTHPDFFFFFFEK